MTQFFTNEAISLEKEVDFRINSPTKTELIDDTYELKKCENWILENNYQKVCLQFPDHLLPDSSEVALRLGKRINRTVYILADTAYESCCIDYVAAAHITADAIIHFGPICFSKTSANIPYLNIYEKNLLDLDHFSKSVDEIVGELDKNLVILLDTAYIHLIDEIQAKFCDFVIKTIDKQDLDIKNRTVVFLGGRNSDRKLLNLKFSNKPKILYYYNPELEKLVNFEQDDKILRRRYFLIEKIKDSNTVGIVIGTLAVKNYLKAIDRLKTLFNLHKKKYYLISVGKPTVAKLANFPEIDIYVVVTCALNEIYDSRDFYKPIVTIYDVEMALNSNYLSPLDFTYDYNDVIARPINEVVDDSSDVSLITGNIRGGSNVSMGEELVAKETGAIALNTNYGAGFLAARTWQGLERNLGGGDVKIAEEGRTGIAQGYTNESGGEGVK